MIDFDAQIASLERSAVDHEAALALARKVAESGTDEQKAVAAIAIPMMERNHPLVMVESIKRMRDQALRFGL